MNVATSFSLYLAGSFALIYPSLVNIVPRDYLGGLVIGLFIFGVLYAWGNTIYQTERMLRLEERELQLEENVERQQRRQQSESEQTEEALLVPA